MYKKIWIIIFSLVFSNPGYNSYLSDSSNPIYYNDGGMPFWFYVIGGMLLYLFIKSEI